MFIFLNIHSNIPLSVICFNFQHISIHSPSHFKRNLILLSLRVYIGIYIMGISEDKIEDKIIVLKAFDLGYVIREKDELTEQTLKLLDNAIDQLSKKTKKTDLINLLFYLIVKCELLRFNNNIKHCREKAQEIAQQINKQHMFKDYMAIVEVTTRKPRVKDINQQTLHNMLHHQ